MLHAPTRASRHLRGSLLLTGLLLFLVGAPAPARAETSEASPHEQEAFDIMNVLSRAGVHDLKEERWNAYGQFTWISSLKAPFNAPYTNFNGSTNSLSPALEHSFTGTLTLYLGLKLWPGAEIYEVPEVIAEKPLSHLAGLGGVIQNFELQKTGSVAPSVYNSRVYLRQRIELGGGRLEKTSDPLRLGGEVDRRRLVLTVGNFSVTDFFDKNAYSGDLRRQFFNMAFLSYSAFDFAADARGYGWGGVAELFFDDWSFRIGRVTAPKDPNQLAIDPDLTKHYGDQVEIEHDHALFGRDGAVRVLGYRNQENMARFDDAIAAFTADRSKNATTCTTFNYGSANASAPDLCWARKENVKMGIGINLDQEITDEIGVFFRGMVSDGQTEVYSYTSTDSSLSLGFLARGRYWRRSSDTLGVGYAQGWISASHARYLKMGGVDGFLGDGKLNQASEQLLEVFYSMAVISPIWLSLDYQHIWNPGYNADRGPVDIFGGRMHVEF